MLYKMDNREIYTEPSTAREEILKAANAGASVVFVVTKGDTSRKELIDIDNDHIANIQSNTSQTLQNTVYKKDYDQTRIDRNNAEADFVKAIIDSFPNTTPAWTYANNPYKKLANVLHSINSQIEGTTLLHIIDTCTDTSIEAIEIIEKIAEILKGSNITLVVHMTNPKQMNIVKSRNYANIATGQSTFVEV